MNYSDEIVRLVTDEAAKGVGHRKVLQPLLNMVASVLAGIEVEQGVDDRLVTYAQVDKFFEKYREAYLAQNIDTSSNSTVQ